MKIKIFDSDSKFKLWQWHTWFAWRPVFVGDDLVWLEKIARKRTGSTLPAFYWKYKYLTEDAENLLEEYEKENEALGKQQGEFINDIVELEKQRDDVRRRYCWAMAEHAEEAEARQIAKDEGWNCFDKETPNPAP